MFNREQIISEIRKHGIEFTSMNFFDPKTKKEVNNAELISRVRKYGEKITIEEAVNKAIDELFRN